ncbi:GNAT family N-acetyltransferase [Streptomyces sp. NPDC020489]|uniref:GNAT family N-acetyltransferase n=1 Tax=Streptomyces sp. NPDC020489 TaxID=3365077 RepID=UPI00379B0910
MTAEYGWHVGYEGLVARIVAALDGRAVGCVMCVRDAPPVTRPAAAAASLVEPQARGLGIGIGGRLVAAGVDLARGVRCRRLVPGTSDMPSPAPRLSRRRGSSSSRDTAPLLRPGPVP